MEFKLIRGGFLFRRRLLMNLMRSTFFLFFCSVFAIAPKNVLSQNTKIVISNDKLVTVDEIFKMISDQTDYTFIYHSDLFKNLPKVQLQKGVIGANDLINQSLSDNSMIFEITSKNTIIIKENIKEVNAEIIRVQQKEISGTVRDVEGNSLPGASVLIKGTSNGVMTDFDGNYSIKVTDEVDNILVFSYLGMKTLEIVIGSQTVINIVMESESQSLDELIIVAYNTVTKESFTGSAKTLDNTKIKSVQSTDVAEALQGNISGVEISQSSGSPGASTSIRIRGVGSLNSSYTPLIIVDGMPYGNLLSSINPNDIESLTVLKDAVATSLYGSRAANGVIVITTKTGKIAKTTVEITARMGVSSRAVADYKTVNAREYYELMWEGYYNAYSSTGTPNAAELASQSVISDNIYNPYNTNSPFGPDGKIKPDAVLLWDENWSDAIYKTGQNQDYGIAFKGGSEKSQHYISLGYSDFEGIIPNSDFKRFTARINNHREIFDWLNIGFNASGSTSKNNEPIGSSGDMSSFSYQSSAIPSIYPIYMRDNNGNIINDSNGDPLFDYGLNGDEDGRVQRPYWATPGYNYLGSEKYDKNEVENTQMSLRVFFDMELVKNLKLKTSFSYDYTNIGGHVFNNPKYGIGVNPKGISTRNESTQKSWTLNNILTYNKKVKDHSFNVLLGQELYKLSINNFSATKTNFDFEDLDHLDNGSVTRNVGSYEDNYRISSLLSQFNYDYDNRYYLSLSYRADGSSRFHKDVRWGDFWSVGAAWRVSNETFMKGTKDWLNSLKMKYSFGTVGNDNIGTYYAYQQLYSTGHNNLNNTGIQVSRIGTPTLTWEVSKTSNLGLEAKMFDVLHIDIDFFKRKVEDMLFKRPLPLSAGVNSVDENIGDMQNVGVEINMFLDIIKKEDFSWSIELNATHYKNKITRLVIDEITKGNFQYKVGGTANDFYIKEWAGVDPATGGPLYFTDPKGVENRGTTGDWFAAPKFNQGSSLPKVYGGFTNTINYKNIELSFMWNYKYGGKVYDSGRQLITHSGIYAGLNFSRDVLDRWTPENTDSAIPKMDAFNYHGNINSTRYLLDNSYLRLRNLSVSYNLPSSLCEKLNVENAKLSLIGQNLITISGLEGIDPEAGFNNVSNYEYPQAKVISLGLNVNL